MKSTTENSKNYLENSNFAVCCANFTQPFASMTQFISLTAPVRICKQNIIVKKIVIFQRIFLRKKQFF